MAKMKLPKNWLIWVIGALFIMSVYPGQGTKASNQQALITTDYVCKEPTDCPTCVGGFVDVPEETLEEDFTFLEELAYAKCEAGTCKLSEYCLIWDCGNVEECQSIKQTLLDNTIARLRERPGMILLIGLAIIAYFML